MSIQIETSGFKGLSDGGEVGMHGWGILVTDEIGSDRT